MQKKVLGIVPSPKGHWVGMASPLAQRPLGAFAVSAIGLGCMNLSHAYAAPPSADVAAQVLLRALAELKRHGKIRAIGLSEIAL
jgi:aryl-alcohol dehydrogenase-like predicted oxidoreductase